MKFIPVKDGDNDEEFAVDDEGGIKVFQERDNNNTDDDGASSDEDLSSRQGNNKGSTFNCKPSKSGISYTTKEFPNQRRR